MNRRVFSYPSLGDSPTIFVNIFNPVTGRLQLFQMLLDTGASRTCLPTGYARFFGHDNSSPRVKSMEVSGVGGKSKAYIHTLMLQLVDPDGGIDGKSVVPWESDAWKSCLSRE